MMNFMFTPFAVIGAVLLYTLIPAIVLYFVIKIAVRDAIKDLKDKNIL